MQYKTLLDGESKVVKIAPYDYWFVKFIPVKMSVKRALFKPLNRW